MAEHANVVRVTHFQPAAGKREELSARLESLAAPMRSMDGCFGVQVCAVQESPEEIVVISRWSSQGALDQLANFLSTNAADVMQLVSGPARTEHFKPL